MKIKINRLNKSIQGHSNQQVHNSRERKDTKDVIIDTVSKVGEVRGEDTEEEVTEGCSANETKENSCVEDLFGVLFGGESEKKEIERIKNKE